MCNIYVQQLISLSRLGAFEDHTMNREDVRKELKGAYSHMWHYSIVCVCVWHDSFMCVAWLIWGPHNESRGCAQRIKRCMFTYVTWLIRVCYMTHSCVLHDSSMCVAWLIILYISYMYIYTRDDVYVIFIYVREMYMLWACIYIYIFIYSFTSNESLEVICSKN